MNVSSVTDATLSLHRLGDAENEWTPAEIDVRSQ
jgi:hypothetical protein